MLRRTGAVGHYKADIDDLGQEPTGREAPRTHAASPGGVPVGGFKLSASEFASEFGTRLVWSGYSHLIMVQRGL